MASSSLPSISRRLSVFLTAFIVSSSSLSSGSFDEPTISRADFPCDFLFGVATSATQIEGAALEFGKGPSIWDHFASLPGKIRDQSNPSIAIDSYNRYKNPLLLLKDGNDIKALRNLGVNAYRFSLSWSKILPDGTTSGGIDQLGIDYYNNPMDVPVIHQLSFFPGTPGIKPFVTSMNNDFLQALQDKYWGLLESVHRGLLTNRGDFKDYMELCFKTFGDGVKNWITINEPLITIQFGHDIGFAVPGRCSPPRCSAGNSSTEPYLVGHYHLLARADAVKLYREKFQKDQGGEIGISLVGKISKPYLEYEEDKRAVTRAIEFGLGW